MKSIVGCILLCLLSCAGFAQETLKVPETDRVQLDEVLQRYLAAYQHKSLPDLVAVWPDLEKQKKEYDKIKHHFADASLSDEQVSVTPLEFQSSGNLAVLRVERVEMFVKTETISSSYTGDNRTGNMPGQDPGPYRSDKKKDVRKDDKVWITMRRGSSGWTIVSISDKNPLPAVRPVV